MYIADIHFLIKYSDFLKSLNQKKKNLYSKYFA